MTTPYEKVQSQIYAQCRNSKHSGGASEINKREFATYQPQTSVMRVAKLIRQGQGRPTQVPITTNYLGRAEGQRGGSGAPLRNVR